MKKTLTLGGIALIAASYLPVNAQERGQLTKSEHAKIEEVLKHDFPKTEDYVELTDLNNDGIEDRIAVRLLREKDNTYRGFVGTYDQSSDGSIDSTWYDVWHDLKGKSRNHLTEVMDGKDKKNISEAYERNRSSYPGMPTLIALVKEKNRQKIYSISVPNIRGVPESAGSVGIPGLNSREPASLVEIEEITDDNNIPKQAEIRHYQAGDEKFKLVRRALYTRNAEPTEEDKEIIKKDWRSKAKRVNEEGEEEPHFEDGAVVWRYARQKFNEETFTVEGHYVTGKGESTPMQILQPCWPFRKNGPSYNSRSSWSFRSGNQTLRGISRPLTPEQASEVPGFGKEFRETPIEIQITTYGGARVKKPQK